MSNTDLKSQKLAIDLELADKLHVDAESGLITPAEDFYESTLPAGLSVDMYKKFQKHDSALMAATTLVGGIKAAEAFTANPELKEVSLRYSSGLSHVSAHYERDGTTPVRNMVETYGASNRGELNKVYKHVAALFDGISN